MNKDKIQRMRNLVSGNYGDKTKSSIGYKTYNKKRHEGEQWEESGKTWVVKNGIKQSISKIKKHIDKIPITCPKCEKTRLNHPAHKKMYLVHKHCLNCQNKFEFSLREKGEYDAWFIAEIKKNFTYWAEEKTSLFNAWLESTDVNRAITESGEVEAWSKLSVKAKEDVKIKFEEWIKSEEEKVDEILKTEEN
jgi:hypothetical protein